MRRRIHVGGKIRSCPPFYSVPSPPFNEFLHVQDIGEIQCRGEKLGGQVVNFAVNGMCNIREGLGFRV